MSDEVRATTATASGEELKSRELAASTHRPRERQSYRESIETFVIVFVGFLTWSLEAEGFVIPTGSMAPTLMGRHKELNCPQCGHMYRVNADREVDNSGRGLNPGARIAWGTCENCRFETEMADLPSFSGDRVYVSKTGVSLPFVPKLGSSALERWDVAVFKLPEEPEVRYIKRLVGMPDEVIRISGGDLWVRRRQVDSGFVPLRRPFMHQQAMQVTVWDDSHRPSALRNQPEWNRWSSASPGDWSDLVPGTFRRSASDNDWKELRYRHLVPRPNDWASINEGKVPPRAPRPSLITDFLSYNTDVTEQDRADPYRSTRTWLQPHWVGDLTLSMKLVVHRSVGKVRFELVRSGVVNRCEIDLATGDAVLSHDGQPLGVSAATEISAVGEHDLVFTNVDGRLALQIDGRLPFGDGLGYWKDELPLGPTAADLEPARIAINSDAVEIQSLILKRDVHYTLSPSQPDYGNLRDSERLNADDLFDLLADPKRFALLTSNQPREFEIHPGHYLMLGDNSPWSRDSRAWGNADQVDPDLPGQGWDHSGRASWEVPAELLIGKAFCVYWPHLKPIWPAIAIGADTRLPARPYAERMRWIR